MLSPIVRRDAPVKSEGFYLVHEAWNSDGLGVVTVVASVNPLFGEWRAYWRADDHHADDEARFDLCRRFGNKLDPGVARAMFPRVEAEYGVIWRP